VLDWLAIRKTSLRLIAAAGDQVPPGTSEYRIKMMRDLVEKFGQYWGRSDSTTDSGEETGRQLVIDGRP